MSVPTVAVSIALSDQDGVSLAGTRITARLNRPELYNGFVVPVETAATTDINGAAVLHLFPNQLGSQGSQYDFKLSYPSGYTLNLQGTVPNAACTLESIVNLPVWPAAAVGQAAVDTAIAAMGGAQTAEAGALAIFVNTVAMQAAVTATTNNAAAAHNSELAAAGSELWASGSATAAHNSELAAAGSASGASGSATAAHNSELAAAGSASGASGSATAAHNSELAAAGSASGASGSATAAHNSELAAAGSASGASGSATAAHNSELAAAGSASGASGSATAAHNSELAAAGSASGASGSATAAHNSELAAAGSATTAATEAGIATTQAAAAALSAQHAVVPSQALNADYTVLETDMGSMLLCTGPMIITFPAASSIGAYAVPIFIGNINLPNVTVSGLPALVDHLEFGQFEGFLSDGSSWRRMVGDSNSRTGKLRATVNASPWTAVLTSDSLTPVALNQITPPLNSAFEFAGIVIAKAVSTTVQNEKSAKWEIKGSGYIDATANSLVLFAVTITNPTSNTTWSVSVTADLTNGSVQIGFAGDQAVRLVAEIGTVMLP